MISQKRMGFSISTIPFAPQRLNPGSCQAERIHASLAKSVVPLTMTREESELKQLAYERQRALRRKEIGIKDTL